MIPAVMAARLAEGTGVVGPRRPFTAAVAGRILMLVASAVLLVEFRRGVSERGRHVGFRPSFHATSKGYMAQPTSPGVPTGPPLRPSVTRSDSISSTNSAHSTVSLKRRSRTRTRTLTSAGRRGKSVGPAYASRVCCPFFALFARP